jgi:ATP-dependent helicase YprA (DUF1998 family)
VPDLNTDPLGAFEQIRDNFLRYVRTVYRTRFASLEAERTALLCEPGKFFQLPCIEPQQKYQTGRTLAELGADDLPGMDADARGAAVDLLTVGLFGGEAPPLYLHQLDMLRLVLGGRNAVATTGTGSGKTEAFLMPVIARLVRERLRDRAAGRKRLAALRALILYPMNALVEDQMNRLRGALDSDGARRWAERTGVAPISFARYNRDTPVAGYPLLCAESDRVEPGGEDNSRKLEQLRRRLGAMTKTSKAIDAELERTRQALKEAREAGDAREIALLAAHLEMLEEARTFAPRHDGAEMRSRWDIQASPPDLLVTNFSMLMRQIEQRLFDNTARWLRTNEDNVFHLVIDELHLYRGTAGSEVAYLIRVVLERLGLHPGHPQLRIVASSASLEAAPDDPSSSADSRNFLRQFFGMAWEHDQIVTGRRVEAPAPASPRPLPFAPFAALADALGNPDAEEAALAGIAAALGGPAAGTVKERLSVAFLGRDQGTAHRLLRACTHAGTIRAVRLDLFAEGMFGPGLTPAEQWRAVRGFLAARARCRDANADETPLPALRLHWLFRNVEGLWAAARTEPSAADPDRTAGRLLFKPTVLDDGRRVLELLLCDQCGTTFFGGNRFARPDGEGWQQASCGSAPAQRCRLPPSYQPREFCSKTLRIRLNCLAKHRSLNIGVSGFRDLVEELHRATKRRERGRRHEADDHAGAAGQVRRGVRRQHERRQQGLAGQAHRLAAASTGGGRPVRAGQAPGRRAGQRRRHSHERARGQGHRTTGGAHGH